MPDAGAVRVDDQAVPAGDPGAAIRAGIGTAFQHFSLVDAFTVAESFALAGLDPAIWQHRLSGRIDEGARIAAIGIADRQHVELVKARGLASKVLLLDEPTSVLGHRDIEQVLEEIRSAANDGVTVLFVTHRLREALEVADRIIVLRHGFKVGAWLRTEEGWEDNIETELTAAMFGDEPAGRIDTQRPNEPNEPLEGGRISVTPVEGAFRLTATQGRVLAIAGIAGNGQRELAGVLSGERESHVDVSWSLDGSGSAPIAGQDWIRRNGTIIPEDRMREGGAPDMSVGETLVLRDLVRNGRPGRWVSRRRLRHRAESMIRRLRISPPEPRRRFGELSGGNMQRVVLARALDPPPTLLVAIYPTQGLDLQTAVAVRQRLREVAATGTAVVSFEQELDDALWYADDIAVMFRGDLSFPIPVAGADRKRLQLMMVAGW